MIISASYKTDIPTFYGEWFINRLRAGYCKMVNPFGKQVYRIGLNHDSVEGFVFWTKNVGPFLRHLVEVKRGGFPFVVQHTINGYPRSLEFSVVDEAQSIRHVKTLAELYGPTVVVWRYDTIVLTSETPFAFHEKNFERLATSLAGATDEVVISFAQIYKKTRSNMNWASHEFGFTWQDPTVVEKRVLTTKLAKIASQCGMQLSMCAQPELIVPGVAEARCIDARRISKLSGSPLRASISGNRPGCACYESRDIGEYDTCPHGCVYCYAVRNRDLALKRYKEHDPTGEFLFSPRLVVATDDESPPEELTQIKLF